MKRLQLIEYGIIVVGLIFGYKFFESVFTAVVQLFSEFFFKMPDLMAVLLPTIFVTVAYYIVFIYLLRKSREIAVYLNGNNADDTILIKIGKGSLLRVILIGIGFATILAKAPHILIYLYGAVKRSMNSRAVFDVAEREIQWEQFKISGLQILLAVVAIIYSNNIASWFLRKDKLVDELTFESNPENEEQEK